MNELDMRYCIRGRMSWKRANKLTIGNICSYVKLNSNGQQYKPTTSIRTLWQLFRP